MREPGPLIATLALLALAACDSGGSSEPVASAADARDASAADGADGDGGGADAAGRGDGGDGGDGGPAQLGEPCNGETPCAPDLVCRTGIGPNQFTGMCVARSKAGEKCVVRTPGGDFDCACCEVGLVCDLQADQCKVP